MARLRGLFTGHGGATKICVWKVRKHTSRVFQRSGMAYPLVCAEQKRVSLLHHVYHFSKLANKRYEDGTPIVDCLDNQTQKSLNALLVQATRTENKCKQPGCADNYSVLPGTARLEVIRILIGAGADQSAIWKTNIRHHRTLSPFCAMFDRTPGFLDDIKFFIENRALQNIPWYALDSCIISAVEKLNISLLNLLMAHEVNFPRQNRDDGHELDNHFRFRTILNGDQYRNQAEKVGLLVDLNLFRDDGLLSDFLAQMIFRLPTVALGQTPTRRFLTQGMRQELDVIQFLCAKGCSAPSPRYLLWGVERRDLNFLFLVLYVFSNRGTPFEFPELKMEDIEYRNRDGELEPKPIPDWMKTQAALLAEMIRRSTKSCPTSFLDMMTFISTGDIPKLRDRTVPRLQDLCLLAVRTKVLIPDVKERFAENWVVWNKVPAHPRLILPAGCLVPPAIESKIFLGDLHDSWMATSTDNMNEIDGESDADGEQYF